MNELVQLAGRQAIKTGVYSLLMEGALKHLWEFKENASGENAITEYLIRRDGNAKKLLSFKKEKNKVLPVNDGKHEQQPVKEKGEQNNGSDHS